MRPIDSVDPIPRGIHLSQLSRRVKHHTTVLAPKNDRNFVFTWMC